MTTPLKFEDNSLIDKVKLHVWAVKRPTTHAVVEHVRHVSKTIEQGNKSHHSNGTEYELNMIIECNIRKESEQDDALVIIGLWVQHQANTFTYFFPLMV